MVPKYMIVDVEVNCPDSRSMPVRAHDSDAGADLRSINSCEVYPGEIQLVDTGVAIKIPVGFVGMVVPRSSMGKVRVGLANTVGIIDSDYRGNIKLMLVNDGVDPFIVKALDTRIAQLIIMPVVLANFVQFNNGMWDETARSTGGFGSTGV